MAFQRLVFDAQVFLDPFPPADPADPVRSQSARPVADRGDQHAEPDVSSGGQYAYEQHVGTERDNRRRDERADEKSDVSPVEQCFHDVLTFVSRCLYARERFVSGNRTNPCSRRFFATNDSPEPGARLSLPAEDSACACDSFRLDCPSGPGFPVCPALVDRVSVLLTSRVFGPVPWSFSRRLEARSCRRTFLCRSPRATGCVA